MNCNTTHYRANSSSVPGDPTIESFDASQSQELLKSLTQGLGIALLTTMVGLVGNILLGLQLTRLDRFADALVADAQAHGITVAHGAG